jgi:hypothetical protein
MVNLRRAVYGCGSPSTLKHCGTFFPPPEALNFPGSFPLLCLDFLYTASRPPYRVQVQDDAAGVEVAGAAAIGTGADPHPGSPRPEPHLSFCPKKPSSRSECPRRTKSAPGPASPISFKNRPLTQGGISASWHFHDKKRLIISLRIPANRNLLFWKNLLTGVLLSL